MNTLKSKRFSPSNFYHFILFLPPITPLPFPVNTIGPTRLYLINDDVPSSLGSHSEPILETSGTFLDESVPFVRFMMLLP